MRKRPITLTVLFVLMLPIVLAAQEKSASRDESLSAYSNINASLLGYLVECITGTPFNEYCRKGLFRPARHARGELVPSRHRHFSHGCSVWPVQPSGKTRRVPNYGWPGYPDGMATAVFLDDKSISAAVVWISGGVLETPEGQAFFADLHHQLVAEMERSGRLKSDQSDADLASRIQQVQNGIEPIYLSDNEPPLRLNLEKLMELYKVPGVHSQNPIC